MVAQPKNTHSRISRSSMQFSRLIDQEVINGSLDDALIALEQIGALNDLCIGVQEFFHEAPEELDIKRRALQDAIKLRIKLEMEAIETSQASLKAKAEGITGCNIYEIRDMASHGKEKA